MGGHAELTALWRWFVDNETVHSSPLYAAIVDAAAADDDLLALVALAPAASHYPLMMLAAVHDLVLTGELPELEAVYAGDEPVEKAPLLFREAMLNHRDHVLRVLETRFVQTNECGRASPLALGLAAAAHAVGTPSVLVDAGASAGLNLLYDRYRLEVGGLGAWGDLASNVVCSCAVHGSPPTPFELVDVPRRVGLDRAPVDLRDPVAARWLLACTWPDTGRLERTRNAIAIAASSPPDVRAGDLVRDIEPLLGEVGGDGPTCVVTSWALGYLDVEQRSLFVEALIRAGATRRIAWLSFEHPGVVPGIEAPSRPTTETDLSSIVGLVTFGSDGLETRRAIARVHPHGSAFAWIA